MNEDQFRKMLDALNDGLWYDATEAEELNPVLAEELRDAFLRHLQTGVAGTPAEAWLRAWRANKPPTYELPNPFPKPFDGRAPSASELMRMPPHARKAWLMALYGQTDWDAVLKEYQLVEEEVEEEEEEVDD